MKSIGELINLNDHMARCVSDTSHVCGSAVANLPLCCRGSTLKECYVMPPIRWSCKTSLPKPSTKNFPAIDGPRTKYGCCKWSPFATDGPHTTAIQMMILMAIVVEEPSEALYLRHVKGKISWSSYSYYFIHL